MDEETNLCVEVVGRADGVPTAANFAVRARPMPAIPPSGVLVKVLYATVDPAMRGWLSRESNYQSIPDGAVMSAHGVGEIIRSDNPEWEPGSLVYGIFGWQRFCGARPGDILFRCDPALAPPEKWLSLFGLTAFTAWLGFERYAEPKPGETALVTSASGGVGSMVGQLASALGVRAVGIAGGAEKVARAVEEFGYDQAIDYRGTDDLADAVAAACPNGIDIFFDNVGGGIADAIFPLLNVGARVIQCGTASVGSWIPVPTGPRRERDVLVKRMVWRGFVANDHYNRFPEALERLEALYARGQLRAREHILDGLEEAPGSIEMLYAGRNHGRLCIRVQ